MSDKTAKEIKSKTKDARQMPAPDSVRPKKTKKRKPFKVLYKWKSPPFNWSCFKGWSTMGHYPTRGAAEEAIKTQERKFPERYYMQIKEK